MRVQRRKRSSKSKNKRIIPACAGTTRFLVLFRNVFSDHPRVCGYNSFNLSNTSCDSGSSPRVRVQHDTRYMYDVIPGIIPACAGTTAKLNGIKNPRRDHPRVCGYNIRNLELQPRFLGSSPRVRVQLICDKSVILICGIIPACAGTTLTVFFKALKLADHPRVCGYNKKTIQSCIRVVGSSPRVRVQQ